MSKRSSPTWAEQLQVMRLLADVAALARDPAAQRQHLVDGLNALLRTRVAWFYVVDDFVSGGRPTLRHHVLASDPDPDFLKSVGSIEAGLPMEAEPFADHAMHDASPLQLWTRERVFSRPDARVRYAPSLEHYDAGKVVDGAVGLYRDGTDSRRVVGVALHRMYRDRKLLPRDHGLLKFAIIELRELVRRGHFPLDEAGPPRLPPRLKQVLDRLLRGDGIKQIAREFDLSVWTVREHVQRLYRHFGVDSREGLMACYVSRSSVRPG
jgi:DNA-binding CsgD family transcriptional regulator